MTQPTEPEWPDPITDEELAEWVANERRLRLMLAKPAPWETLSEPYDCGTGL